MVLEAVVKIFEFEISAAVLIKQNNAQSIGRET